MLRRAKAFACLDETEEHKGTFLCIARRTDRDAYNACLSITILPTMFLRSAPICARAR